MLLLQIIMDDLFDRVLFRFFLKMQHCCIQMADHRKELNRSHEKGFGETLGTLKRTSQAGLEVRLEVQYIIFIKFLGTVQLFKPV